MILLDTDHTTFLKYPDSERGRRMIDRLDAASASEVLVVRFTNNVVVGPFLFPMQQELLESAATRVLASSACLVE